jgi:hypothetical protein
MTRSIHLGSFTRLRILAGLSLAGLAMVAVPLTSGGTVAAASAPGANKMVPVQAGISAASLPDASVFGDTPPNTPETVAFVLREQNLPEPAWSRA